MRKRNLPALKSNAYERPQGLQWELSPLALERWSPDLRASTESDASISILDPIGYDPWTGEGTTAKRIAAALRSIGPEKDVTVNINSPGGDLFEGLAIYSLLREHKGLVTIKVLALAASAASIIAMAGDEVQVARAGFLMIHDTWIITLGNRHDLRAVADQLEPFDNAMADVYSVRSGIDIKKIGEMMDKETWINGSEAVDMGFADSLLPSDDVKKEENAKNGRIAAYLLDMALAKAGMPRSERRALLQEYKTSKPSAAGQEVDKPSAVDNSKPCAASMNDVLETLRTFNYNFK